jgi:GNAT superfamily N-acetyltransferase
MHEVRLATADDAERACEVLRRCIRECCVEDHRNDAAILEKWLRNKTPDTVASWFAWPAHYPLVATLQDEVVGIGMLCRPGRIVLLHVDPAWQLAGVGSTLLRRLEARALKSGVPALRVNSTLSARRFYEAHGYRPITMINVPYGSALAMTKRLASRCGCVADGTRT